MKTIFNLLIGKRPTWVQGLGTFVEEYDGHCRKFLLHPKNHIEMCSAYGYKVSKNGIFQRGESELRIRDLEQGNIFNNKASITVGRSPDCDIVFNDSYVSGHHLSITKCDLRDGRKPTYNVRDLESTNGTILVNA